MRISNRNKKRLKKIIRGAKNLSDYILDTEIEELINVHGKNIVSSLKIAGGIILLLYLVGINSSLRSISSKVNNVEICRPTN